MHAAVYRECPEAAFVVHTHADACTALACLGSGLPAFHYMVVQFGGTDVRCAPYVTFGTHGPGGGRGGGDPRPYGVPAGQPRHDRLRGNGGAGAVAGGAAGNVVPAVFAGAVGGDASAADRTRNGGRAGTVQDLRSVQPIVVGHAIQVLGKRRT